tara:strand:- start:3418 stop:4470 length:1053 start_codon:yes stop_codon:yes gene_type:complete
MRSTRPNLASARGVTINRIRQDTTTVPASPGVANFNWGENLPGGPLSDVIIRLATVAATDITDGDTTTLISQLAISLNGERVHQFNAGANIITAENAVGQYGYFLNSIGGSYSEQSGSATNRECYLRIPIGRVLPSGVSRLEFSITYAGAAVALTGQFEMFALYNTNMQTSTYIPTNTSQNNMPAGQQQVVVRIPQKTNFVVSGIMMLSTDVATGNPADNLGANGVVNTSQGPYGLDADLLRFMSGDLSGGVECVTTVTSLAFDGAGAGVQQPVVLPIQATPGAQFIPTFGLDSNSDIVLLIDGAAGVTTNRLFIPVMTAMVGANMPTQPAQTEAVRSNTQKAILDRVDV